MLFDKFVKFGLFDLGKWVDLTGLGFGAFLKVNGVVPGALFWQAFGCPFVKDSTEFKEIIGNVIVNRLMGEGRFRRGGFGPNAWLHGGVSAGSGSCDLLPGSKRETLLFPVDSRVVSL